MHRMLINAGAYQVTIDDGHVSAVFPNCDDAAEAQEFIYRMSLEADDRGWQLYIITNLLDGYSRFHFIPKV